MKKVLFLAFAALMTTVVISSCSHDDYNGPVYQDPSLEKAAIDSFIIAKGFTMVDDTIYKLPGVKTNIISLGDTTKRYRYVSDSTLITFKVTGQAINSSTPFITSDSTLKVDFGQGGATTNSTLINSLLTSYSGSPYNIALLGGYLEYLGIGGRLQFISPSVYSYGPTSRTINNITIAQNSPIYYNLEIIDVSKPGATNP